jgi:hypothetical protein
MHEQPSDRSERHREAGAASARRRVYLAALLVGLLCPMAVAWVFGAVEDYLLTHGLLNTRDLGFVGGETGTLGEYLTNVWYWDAAGMLVQLATWAACLIAAAVLVVGATPVRHGPIQFSLRDVFMVVTGCCVLFAAVTWLGATSLVVALPLVILTLGRLLAVSERGAACPGRARQDAQE